MRKLNLKRLLKKRNNGGFTLIEVVISCALLGILVVGICTFATPVMNAVSRGKASARATLLTEMLDTYIAGILKNARQVEVMQNTTLEAAATGLKDSTDADKGLNTIITFMSDPNNAADYEVRCLGISWVNDSRTDAKRKLMLTTNTLDTAANGYKVKGVSKVFDDVIYNGLYPIINIETFGVVGSASSTSADTSDTSDTSEATPAPGAIPGADPALPVGANANGYRISIVVYSDQKCYNAASDDARHQSKSAYRSESYVKCLGMTDSAPDVNKLTSDVQTAITNSVDSNYPTTVTGASTGALKYTEDDDDFFYPDTYIYYVVPRKTTT